MNNTFLSAIAASALAVSFSANAADLPPRPAQYAAPVVAPYNWTGIYLGINGGYGWGTQDPLNIITNRFDKYALNFSGGLIGGTIGGQIQAGHVVLGVEADLDWANLKGSSNFVPSITGTGLGLVSASTSIDWMSTARLRVGYAADNWLIYATGGLAMLGTQTSLATLAGGAACAGILVGCGGVNRQLGAAIGGGVEYGITPNWSVKAEYFYVTAVSAQISEQSQVRLGVNYRFGGY